MHWQKATNDVFDDFLLFYIELRETNQIFDERFRLRDTNWTEDQSA